MAHQCSLGVRVHLACNKIPMSWPWDGLWCSLHSSLFSVSRIACNLEKKSTAQKYFKARSYTKLKKECVEGLLTTSWFQGCFGCRKLQGELDSRPQTSVEPVSLPLTWQGSFSHYQDKRQMGIACELSINKHFFFFCLQILQGSHCRAEPLTWAEFCKIPLVRQGDCLMKLLSLNSLNSH